MHAKKMRPIWKILIVFAILAFIGVCVFFMLKIVNTKETDTTQTYSGVQVEYGTVQTISEGSGKVTASDSQEVYADYTCRITALYKKNGDTVETGEAVALLKCEDIDETINSLNDRIKEIDERLISIGKSGTVNLTTPVTGYIKRIFCAKDDLVTDIVASQGCLMEISGDEKLKASFVTDQEVPLGTEVTVVCDGISVDGKVVETSGQTVTVTFSDRNDIDVDIEAIIKDKSGNELGTGTVLCNYPVKIIANTGTIKSVERKVNQKVWAGNTVIKLEADGTEEYSSLIVERAQKVAELAGAREYENEYTLTAGISGVISDIILKEDNILPEDTALCTITQTESLGVTVKISELDIGNISPGKDVTVSFDAIPDAEYTGKVSKIFPIGNNEEEITTYDVYLLLDNNENVMIGMTANAKITLDRHETVLVLPIECIEEDANGKYVTRMNDDGTTEHVDIEVGLVNNTYAEITAGLAEGDMVKEPESVTDLAQQMLEMQNQINSAVE